MATGQEAVWFVGRERTIAAESVECIASDAGLRVGGLLDPEDPARGASRPGDVVVSDPAGLHRSGVLVDVLPDRRHLAITHRDDDWFVLRALRSGYLGFLLWSTPADEVAAALHAVADGRCTVCHRLASDIAASGARLSASAFWPGMALGLTERESDVLVGLSRGASTREIAATLYLGEETVRSHLKSLYSKLDVSERGAAVALAFRRGILAPDS